MTKNGYTKCTKEIKCKKKSEEMEKVIPKVIHNKDGEKAEKIELYTKLFTLSTENPTNFEVYIVKQSNKSFVQMR